MNWSKICRRIYFYLRLGCKLENVGTSLLPLADITSKERHPPMPNEVDVREVKFYF